MKNNIDNSYLLEIFGEDKLKERISFLIDSAQYFITAHKVHNYVTINLLGIEAAIIDYFSDIARLKNFHEIEKANPIKVAAYTAYWVLRRKPLHIIKNPDDDTVIGKQFLIDVNEWFVLNLLIAMAFNTQMMLLQEEKTIQNWNNFLDTLHYFLTYRIVTPQSLELSLTALVAEPCFNSLVFSGNK